jgi:pimeloyl-ACP methyl ester carboxylesterase
MIPLLLLLVASLGSQIARAQGMRTETLDIRLSETRTARATLEVPENRPNGKKLPALVVFGGFESAADVLALVHPGLPVALASFDYPFSASRRLQFPESLRALPEAKALYPLTVHGIVGLIAALKQRPEIDSRKIILVGASFGCPFVLGAADALRSTSDVAGIVLVHGFGRVPQTAESVILRSWLPRYGQVARPFAWLLARLGWLYLDPPAPESLAEQLSPGQKVLMITAQQDSFVPKASSDSLWAAVQLSEAQSTRVFMESDHLMPGSDQLIARIIHEIEGWMARAGL